MVRIAPVRLAYNPKTLWFDAGELELNKNDAVVVSTARGLEFGSLAEDVFEVDEEQVKKLKSPLKPVKRLADDEDAQRAEEMRRRSEEALPIFKELAAEASEDMHPVSVEFLLDGDKAVFYFEAEERVDFRDLVRKLASRFHVRIDMRQIGVRDEARMVGGLGHCGQELCCKRLGGEFCPVSIRMAKEQDLSLNPQKISGVCGRLMCCLRYEFDAYKDFKSRAPKQNASVETPVGTAKVVDLDVPREVISLKVDGEKPVKVPLADFEPPEEGMTRPNRVGKEAWEDATTQAVLGIAGESTFLTSQFTGQDKLADPSSVRRTGTNGKSGQKPRNGASKSGGSSASKSAPVPTEARKPRRRSTKVAADGTTRQVDVGESAEKRKKQGSAAAGANGAAPKKQGVKRPGQGSKKNAPRGGAVGSGSGAAQASGTAKKQSVKGTQGQAKQGPRPGQRSSGLRQGQAAAQAKGAGGNGGGANNNGGEGGHRRARRRNHRPNNDAPSAGQGGES